MPSEMSSEQGTPPRCHLSRGQVLSIAICFVVLPATFVALSFARPPRENTPGKVAAWRETSTMIESAGRDCVQFAIYSEGHVIESDYIIGTLNFTFMALRPTRRCRGNVPCQHVDRLHVGVSFSEEQIRQGGHAFCE